MLDDCKYDKVKLLHEISNVAWYLKKHATKNAREMGDEKCLLMYEHILKDIEKQVDTLKKALNEN